MITKCPAITPWGVPDTVNVIANGIFAYTTSAHGGMWLAPWRRQQMPETLRRVEPAAGPGWYEEDIDTSIVVLAFPEEFDDAALRVATTICACAHCWTARGDVMQWLFSSAEAKPLRDRVDAIGCAPAAGILNRRAHPWSR